MFPALYSSCSSLTSHGSTELIAGGYEFTRDRDAQGEGQRTQWQERVLVTRSCAQAAHARHRLLHHLDAATTALRALTPVPGRGKRQITEEATLTQHLTAGWRATGSPACSPAPSSGRWSAATSVSGADATAPTGPHKSSSAAEE